MEEMIKLLSALKGHFTEEEQGLLLKASALEDEIKTETFKRVSPQFLAKMTEISSAKMLELMGYIEDKIDDMGEMELIAETMKFVYGIIDDFKQIDGYDEYENNQIELYASYGLDYKKNDELIRKMFELFETEDGIKALKELG